VTLKEKRAKQKKAAAYIASIMRESLAQFPKEEQSLRVKEIHKIALTIGPKKRDKLSKRSPSARRRPSPRLSSASR
jgi:hypothetical protein